ncbi:unnamed protein product, partial [Rotaria sordida]
MSHFCYNRGCQKKYTPTNDPAQDDTACQYHPGLPYFHDAYKIWSCCQKKSHDFGAFLSLPGCTRGPHQPTKPEEPVAPRATEQEQVVVPKPTIREETPKPRVPVIERPPMDAPLTKMKLTVSTSLQEALEKLAITPKVNTNQKEQFNDEVKPGTSCKHASCGVLYTTVDQEQATPCRFHPGVPIFHEGMKYWSCCQKKTTDFEAFTAQPGCSEGEHLWRVENESSKNEDDPQVLKTSCRYDFHQQGPSVVLSIYAKMPRPDQTQVELNAGRLKVDTRFGTATSTKRFFNEWELFGLIDVNQSTVELLQNIRRLFSLLLCCCSRQKQKRQIAQIILDDPRRTFIYSGIDALNITNSTSLIIADFGSSHGQNSIQTMKIIIEYLTKMNKLRGSPLIIHNDLPMNDWTRLFQLLAEDNSYRGLANGCSFYEECLPRNCLSIAFSSASLHILSKKPCNINNHCYFHFANENEREIFKNQSKFDFNSFIKYRSQELQSGGILILNIPCVNENGEMGFNFYFDLIYKCAQLLTILTSQELIDFTIPFYLRSLSECIDLELFNRYSLVLIKSELICLKSLIVDQYRHGQIRLDRFAKSLSMLMRPGTDLALKQALQINRRSSPDIERISTQFWSLFEEK